MTNQPQVIDLMGQDNASDCEEVVRVDALVTGWHPETKDEGSPCDNMHCCSIYLIEQNCLVIAPVVNDFRSEA